MSQRGWSMANADKLPVTSNMYFSLKDDKDKANIRFLHTSFEEIMISAVHELQVGTSRMVVGCLRDPHDEVSACPLCAANQRAKFNVYLNVYNEDLEQFQVWQRSVNWVQKNLQGYFERYGSLVGVPLEVVRNGKAGSMETTYQFFPGVPDDTTIESLGVDIPSTLELGVFRVWSYDEVLTYVNTGQVPETENTQVQPQQSSHGPRSSMEAPSQTRRTRGTEF